MPLTRFQKPLLPEAHPLPLSAEPFPANTDVMNKRKAIATNPPTTSFPFAPFSTAHMQKKKRKVVGVILTSFSPIPSKLHGFRYYKRPHWIAKVVERVKPLQLVHGHNTHCLLTHGALQGGWKEDWQALLLATTVVRKRDTWATASTFKGNLEHQ